MNSTGLELTNLLFARIVASLLNLDCFFLQDDGVCQKSLSASLPLQLSEDASYSEEGATMFVCHAREYIIANILSERAMPPFGRLSKLTLRATACSFFPHDWQDALNMSDKGCKSDPTPIGPQIPRSVLAAPEACVFDSQGGFTCPGSSAYLNAWAMQERGQGCQNAWQSNWVHVGDTPELTYGMMWTQTEKTCKKKSSNKK
jgi:hypothetical protein